MVSLESRIEPDYKMMLKELIPDIVTLKGCQKCQGDIYFDRDVWGPYFSCVQAGHTIQVDTPRGKELTLLAYRSRVARKVA